MSKKRTIIITVLSIIIVAILFLVANSFINKKDTSYAIKVNGKVITPQVYKSYLIQKTLLAISKNTDTAQDIWEQKIDGLNVSEWILTNACDQIIFDTVVKEEVKREKMQVWNSDKERLETYLNQHWDQNEVIYTENKCDREAFNTAFEADFYKELLFEQYSKDHPSEKSIAPVPSATVTYFMIDLFGLDGNRFTEAQVNVLIKLAKGYVKQCKGKKTIDDVYRSYQKQLGENLIQNQPLSPLLISSDNEEYTSKIPKFVDALMKAKIGEPFYVRDELYITIGIRQKDTNDPVVKKAYLESRAKNASRNDFEEVLAKIIEKAEVEKNDFVIKQYSPKSIRLPKG